MKLRSVHIILALGLLLYGAHPIFAAQSYVNIPYLGSTSSNGNFVPDIFWFGEVTPTANYADVRTWHFDQEMRVVIHVVDKRLFTTGDRILLYVSFDGTSYRFEKQLWNPAVSYTDTGAGWAQTPIEFTAHDGWRGNSPNDAIDDRGWVAEFTIPFSSLELSSPPVSGTEGKIAVVLQDRDDTAGTPIPDQKTPDTFDENNPETWSILRFGRPAYTAPHVPSPQTITIKHGLNGSMVPDAHVGGHSTCGGDYDYWTEWGLANYTGFSQMNIQNQWDIADFPCFSKYYVTFPLDQLPVGKEIVSGTVTLTLFGNAGGGEFDDPFRSAINAMVVDRDFTEPTVNWNNGPRVYDTISVTWVDPVHIAPAGPYNWDVSRAVSEAYKNGEPLRLAFYSTDGEYHSGKYFWTSDAGNLTQRPALTVVLGDGAPVGVPGDVDGNGSVTLTDLSILLSNFGNQTSRGDANGDGRVTIADLSIVLANFGS